MAIFKFVSKENLAYLVTKLKSFFVSDVTVSGATITVTKGGTATPTTLPNATTTKNGLMTSGDKSKLSGIASGAQVNVIEGVTVGGTAVPVTDKVAALPAYPDKVSQLTNDSGYQTKAQLDAAIDEVKAAQGKVLTYKGTKQTYAQLPTTGNTDGDVWNVVEANGNVPAGTNYAWDGTQWDPLGGTVDLSGYVQDSDLQPLTEAEIDAMFA